jgi:N-acetylglucosaminyl-diphospho-decaprenol L-rhamnosyltransferase
MSFAVVTLNWNGMAVLPPMIRSLAAEISDLKGRLVVWDNGSSDGSPEAVAEEWKDSEWFSLVRSPENLGFAMGANRAVAGIEADLIVLANSDTVFLPGSLETILEALERNPENGVIAPRLLWPDGSLQPSMRDFPFPGKLIGEHLPVFRRKAAINDPHDRARSTDWVVGAVMAFRRELFLSHGGFDTDFFFYHEETELQYRLTSAGHPTLFVPSAEVIHVEGASARQMFGKDTYTKYIRGKATFLRKHGYMGSVALFRVFMGSLQIFRLVTGILRPALSGKDGRYSAAYCRKALREVFRRNGLEMK